ncbi:MAG: HEAT repeat domain-containing protein [Limisphaerales bacterium]
MPHLQTCLKDEDEEVRAAAAQAMRSISGTGTVGQ